jgi:integrase
VKIRASAQGWPDWPEHAIEQFEKAYPIGSRERLAFALLLYTGQRRGDIIRMGRQHVRGGLLTVRQSKTGAVVAIPIHQDLEEVLAASEAQHLTFLTTATGKPFAPGGIHELVWRSMPRRWSTDWPISAWATQGHVSASGRGWMHRQSDRSGKRPRHVAGSFQVHESGRSKAHGGRCYGGHSANKTG